jgi:cell division protease FtsH
MMQSTRTTRGADQRETSQASRFTQNSSNRPNRSPGGSAPQGTSPSRQSSWLRWLIFIIVTNLLFYAPLLFSSSSGQPTINLPYTGFLQQVQQGNVKDVTLTGNAISGDFKTPLHQPQSGTGNTTVAYSQFTSYVPETGDTNLLPLLEKNDVQVTAQPVQIPW